MLIFAKAKQQIISNFYQYKTILNEKFYPYFMAFVRYC